MQEHALSYDPEKQIARHEGQKYNTRVCLAGDIVRRQLMDRKNTVDKFLTIKISIVVSKYWLFNNKRLAMNANYFVLLCFYLRIFENSELTLTLRYLC